MIYLVQPPYWRLAKTNPKEYQEQWVAYVKSRIYAQQRIAQIRADIIGISMLKRMQSQSIMPRPCIGCTLGKGFGLFG